MRRKAAITSIGDSLPVAACAWTQTPTTINRDGGLGIDVRQHLIHAQGLESQQTTI